MGGRGEKEGERGVVEEEKIGGGGGGEKEEIGGRGIRVDQEGNVCQKEGEFVEEFFYDVCY